MNEDEDIGSAETMHFKRVSSYLLEFYLVGSISGPENYISWFNAIRNAGPDDIIKIYINSPGGRVDTAQQMLRCMSDTDAQIICSIEGECSSAATMIFLGADGFEISPNSIFMIHNYSGGQFGKGNELYSRAIFERSWSIKFMEDTYKHFLDDEEIKKVMAGEDFYMDSNEVLERCTRLAKARAKEAKESQ